MTVVEGVRADLAAFGGVSGVGGLAAAALELAGQLDDPGVSATAKAACARSLADCLDRIRELVPPVEKDDDRVDELASKRSARRAAS